MRRFIVKIKIQINSGETIYFLTKTIFWEKKSDQKAINFFLSRHHFGELVGEGKQTSIYFWPVMTFKCWENVPLEKGDIST